MTQTLAMMRMCLREHAKYQFELFEGFKLFSYWIKLTTHIYNITKGICFKFIKGPASFVKVMHAGLRCNLL